jgi:hypothetical protein
VRSWSAVHLGYQARRAIGLQVPAARVARRREELCGSEEQEVAPAIFLPGQLDNVVALLPLTTREQEDKRVHARAVRHGPTVAYWIDGARLRDFGVYKDGWARYLTQVATTRPPRAGDRRTGVSALATSLLGGRFFGHWMHSDAATYLLAESVGRPACAPYPDWPHRAFYADCYGQDWTPIASADFETLVVFDDFAQNSNCVARYETLRRRLRSRVRANSPGGLVYLRRGAGGATKRVLSNETQIVDRLVKEGFCIVDAGQADAAAIAAGLLDARLAVSIEGSHQTHLLPTLNARGGLLSIVPPDMFGNAARDWSAALGMRWGFVVGEGRGGAFRIDECALLRTIELMLAEIDRGRDGATPAAASAAAQRACSA